MKPPFILKSSIRLDRLFAAYDGQTALITSSGEWTFNDVRRCLRNVIFNLESAGVRRGHRVGFHAQNSELHLYLFLASWLMDFLYMPLDFKAPLQRLPQDGNLDFLITDEEGAAAARPVILRPEGILQGLLPFMGNDPWRAVSFRQEASAIFTSGSTGKPRGLVHTVGNYIYSALGTNAFLGLSAADRWLISLPLFHVGGVLIWVRTLLAGGAAILPLSQKDIGRDIATHRPSVLSLVPAQLIRLLDDPGLIAHLRSCRAILLGGAPTPAWLIQKALDLAIPVMPTYGSTEACAQVTGVALHAPRSAYKTAGRPVLHREVRINDDGLILLGGKTIFKRYLEDKKQTHLQDDGFFKTADAGRLDGDGNLVCLGRTDGIFISGGENIDPFEIENSLLEREGITAAFVVPVWHREFGKAPWAFVETEALFDEGQMILSLKARLPGYKIPKRIIRLNPEDKKEKLKYSRETLRALAVKIAGTGDGQDKTHQAVLHCTVHGAEHEETIVFLHGFMGNCHALNDVILPLSRRYRCIAFDLPGHGQSLFGTTDAFASVHRMENVAVLVLQSLDALNIGRFSLYGYSMGGRVAQAMALHAPRRIQRLILESASFGIANTDERQERYARDQNLLHQIKTQTDFAKFLANWYALPLFKSLRGTALLARMINVKRVNDVSELRRALDIMSVGHHPFYAQRLAALKIPLYYFCGEQDEAYLSVAETAKQMLPGLQVTIFSGASHDVHSQYPDAVVRRLEQVMTGVETL